MSLSNLFETGINKFQPLLRRSNSRLVIKLDLAIAAFLNEYTINPRSSLVEGDEQLDWPNSQTTTELCHACVA